MQDLGKITIDINEGGKSSAGGAAGGGATPSGAVKSIVGQGMNKALDATSKSISGAASAASRAISAINEQGAKKAILDATSGFISGAASSASAALVGVGLVIGGVTAAFAVLVLGVKLAIDALVALHKFVMEMASEIREYSPGIQLAELGNELNMMMTKLRLGGQYGASIGAQIKEAGRADRAALEIKTALAAMGSVFLRPITKILADILEGIVSNLPKIINAMAALATYMAEASRYATREGVGRELHRSLIPAGARALFDQQNPESPLVKMWKDIAAELRAINRKMPDPSYKALNAPFLADLALMGARI